jgi:hypothetical protein
MNNPLTPVAGAAPEAAPATGTLGGTTRLNMTTTFSQTGGVRVGGGSFIAFNASWPFASLRVTDSELTLACLGKRWVFPRTSIRKLTKHQGLFSLGLRIEHSIESYAEFLVFWTFRFPNMQRELELRGYAVS